MRTRRIYGFGDQVVYHCVTRTVNGEMLFGEKEKAVMRGMLKQVADFSGVEVLTYAVMTNHVHVLVRVDRQAKAISDEELVRRFKVLYPKPTPHRTEDVRVLEQMLRDNTEDGQKLREQLTARMGDVSEFMKTLKQRFSRWFNKSQGRYGPLWCDRFKSTVVEGTGAVLRTVAAYIDLNPVRAGLVEDPKDYRYCGYADAVAGDGEMRRSMCVITGLESAKSALAAYRIVLFGKGAGPKRDGSGGRIDGATAQAVMDAQGQLPEHVFLRQRIAHMSHAAVLGTKFFVERHIQAWGERLGDRRERRPVPIDADHPATLQSFRRVRG